MQKPSQTKQIGLKVIVKVDSFYQAKRKLYSLIQAGICTCADCDQPATQIHWVDQAEWYPYCDDHQDHNQQWLGHHKWDANELVLRVIPNRARAWYDALTRQQREGIKLVEYDATDYYSQITSWDPTNIVTVGGGKEDFTHYYIRVYRLNSNKLAYEPVRRVGIETQTGPLVGAFDTVEDAVKDAQARSET
ncbi:hypothetical protein G4Y79_05300 [Phototrophicus methaneseepsis]|uniref:Uncharacterized protein n=1 Tax=Phototrophicus methaneseepsis TaxID=2710758 RepID=A0A7S8EB99_9CHLR|nr:hypothetical protein [Phototrophicus methaneseepsis]QPC83797.1 hypothetical protein G4Y79_05300 [Phototrophicus methaneseepsis]